MTKPQVVENLSIIKQLVNQLTENLNGARIETVRDIHTGNPVVALTVHDSLQAHSLAMIIRCLTAFGTLPAGVEQEKPIATQPAVSLPLETNKLSDTPSGCVMYQVCNQVSRKNITGDIFGCKQESME